MVYVRMHVHMYAYSYSAIDMQLYICANLTNFLCMNNSVRFSCMTALFL